MLKAHETDELPSTHVKHSHNSRFYTPQKWSKRWFVLFATTHEGVVRIEYYDNESCEATQIGKRTIPLRDSIGLAQIPGNKTQPYMFEITSQIGEG